MKRFIIPFLIVFTSCNYIKSHKKVSSKDILNQELEHFNWNDVDKYPTFKHCDSILEKTESKLCFQKTIVTHVNTFLETQKLKVSETIIDTAQLKMVIDKTGRVTVKSVDLKPKVKFQIPEIDSLLKSSIKGLPKLYPAIKRGQPVTTEFVLPIIIKN